MKANEHDPLPVASENKLKVVGISAPGFKDPNRLARIVPVWLRLDEITGLELPNDLLSEGSGHRCRQRITPVDQLEPVVLHQRLESRQRKQNVPLHSPVHHFPFGSPILSWSSFLCY